MYNYYKGEVKDYSKDDDTTLQLKQSDSTQYEGSMSDYINEKIVLEVSGSEAGYTLTKAKDVVSKGGWR